MNLQRILEVGKGWGVIGYLAETTTFVVAKPLVTCNVKKFVVPSQQHLMNAATLPLSLSVKLDQTILLS